MSPEKKDERNKAIDEAENYWCSDRLIELFCDIYATYLCGPAYYFSCVDLATKISKIPYQINIIDVHPPDATRVYACYRALLPAHQNDEITILIYNSWKQYIRTRSKPHDYDLKCPNALIELIVDKSIQNIEQFLPKAQRYSENITDFWQSNKVTTSDSLEIILNKGMRILLRKPEHYDEWERIVFTILRKQTIKQS